MDEMSDHDLLIKVATIVGILQNGQTNHIEHHRKHDLMMLSVTIGAVLTSIVAMSTAIISFIV